MTDLIPRLRNERYREAREKIWKRFGEALICRAQFVLRDLPNSCGNGEEAAISAFMRFTEKAKAGELNKWPTDSKSLQMLLLRAARDRARDMKRQSLKVKDREWGQTDLAQVSVRDDVDANLIVLAMGLKPTALNIFVMSFQRPGHGRRRYAFLFLVHVSSVSSGILLL